MDDRKSHTPANAFTGEEKMIRVGCPSHNCGGRCLLRVHVRDGMITRIETDDRPSDTVADPQLRACIRGRSYRQRQYHKDRLKYPLKRVGERGSGEFERISWDEATDLMASNINRIKEQYGNTSIYIPYGTGGYSQTNGKWSADRLMNMYGGALGYYNSYSWACISRTTSTVYGTEETGNQRQDWLNSKYIIMWGWNPSEMRDGTNSEYFLKEARKRGARIVCIDPRMTMSAVALADEWIAIRPGTDVALMSAMAYVMITENLYDKSFVDRYCMGFDSKQMPEAFQGEESYKDYILGTRDNQPKTPEWAENITSIPRQDIVRIAREYATAESAVLYQGYGMQRRAYGEQVVRGGCVLAAITGNVGKSGGWASGMALQAGGGTEEKNLTRYYGLGPQSYNGDLSYYHRRTHWGGFELRKYVGKKVELELKTYYSEVEALEPVYEIDQSLGRVHGDEIPFGYPGESNGITARLALTRDNAEQRGRPRSGGFQSLGVSLFEATDDSRLHYLTYHANLEKYFSLWHTDRTLALRGFFNRISNTGPVEIPFTRLVTFQRPDELRGFNSLRFYGMGSLGVAVEYRWPIWVARGRDDLGVDAYLFSDIGQVFDRSAEISLDHLKFTGGAGLRLINSDRGFGARFEVGFSDETTVVRLKFSQTFQYDPKGILYGKNPTKVY